MGSGNSQVTVRAYTGGLTAGRQQRINFSAANEIVYGQAANRMGAVVYEAAVIADLDIRMVVLGVRNPGHGVHERHGFVVITERELAAYLFAVGVN